MSASDEFEHVTTKASVEIYTASSPIFEGLLKEVRELSKKKPEATISSGKVKMINRVLEDLLVILKDQPAGKYLEVLDDATLPQMSDALLTMVQFESALKAFRSRFHRHVAGDWYWITGELLKEWDEAEEVVEEDEEEGDEDEQVGEDLTVDDEGGDPESR
jgi:hypothetical protein